MTMFIKKAIAFLVTGCMTVGFSANAFATVDDATFAEETSMVQVLGTTGIQGQEIIAMLFEQNGENYDIAYFGKTTTDSSGDYNFDFKVEKTANEIKAFTLRVNAGGEDVTDKALTIVEDPYKVIISTPDNSEYPIANSKIHSNNRVYIKGHIGKGFYGDKVTLALIYPKGDIETMIGYFNATTIDANGDYSFKFKFNPPTGNINDYYVRINKAGEEVSNTLIEATVEGEKIYDLETYLVEDGTEAKTSLKVINYYGLTQEEFLGDVSWTQILAFYDANGKLLNAVSQPISANNATVTNEDIVFDFDGAIPTSTALIKGMLWSSFSTMIPIADNEEVKANQRIVCWGDSLTEGAGDQSPQDVTGGESLGGYPGRLATLTGKEVINYGIGGDTAWGIASRQGGNELTLAEAITIPSDTSYFDVKLNDEYDGSENPKVHGVLANFATIGNKGMSPAIINGVECELIQSDDKTEEADSYKFKRVTAGEAVEVPAGTPLILKNAQSTYDDINVIFIGQNGGYPNSNTEGLISVIDSMVEKLESDKYIIVGLTTSDRKAMEPEMEKHFGAKYINMREYIVNNVDKTECIDYINGKDDTWTRSFIEQYQSEAKDYTKTELLEDAQNAKVSGKVPVMLRADWVHLNTWGYDLVAQGIYEKMIELNYIAE